MRTAWLAGLVFCFIAGAASAQRMPSRVYLGTPAEPIVLRAPGAPKAYIEIAPSAKDLADAAARSPGTNHNERYRVGSVFASPEEPKVREWQLTREGGLLTQLVVTSHGAVGMRTQLLLPVGMTNGEVRVASRADGAAESVPLSLAKDGTLWTPYTEGETQIVEIFTRQRAADAQVGVGQIAHFEQSLTTAGGAPVLPGATTAAGTCTVDVACTTNNSALDLALSHRRQSVMRLSFTSGSGAFFCTGTLVNSQSFPSPYVLTANHCISTAAEASSLTTLWFYYAATCGGANPPGTQVSGGAQVTFTNRMVDSTLILLSRQPPTGAEYAGWNAALVNDSDSILSVSHPAGDVMKFATGTVHNPDTTNGWIRIDGYPYDMYAVSFNRGIIQGGSSGSGLFTLNSSSGSLELRGILTGTTITNSSGGMSCTDTNEFALYDRFEVFYPQIQPYLNNTSFPADDNPNQPTATAQTLPLGGNLSASIQYAGDLDTFKIVLTQAGSLTVGSSGSYDTVGTLLNSDGSCIKGSDGECDPNTSNDDGDGNAATDNNFRIDSISLQPGTYYVTVGAWDPNSTTPNGYQVYAQFVPATPTALPLSKRGGIDLDGNNKSAIILRNSANTQMQAGRLVNGQMQFSSLSDPGPNYRLVAALDFDGDGKSDLAIQEIASDPVFGVVSVWPSFSNTSPVTLRTVKKAWLAQAFGDQDGDGFGDITFRFTGDDGTPNDTGVSYIWFTNIGSPTPVNQVRKRGGAPLTWTLLGAADLNGDGAADMIYISPTNDVRALMATGSRTCANLSAGTIPAGFTALKLSDFSGSRRGDILIRNPSTGEVRIMMLSAAGVTLPPPGANPDDPNASCSSTSATVTATFVNLGTADPSWQFYASGDFDGDGVTDVLWLLPSGGLTLWHIGVATNNGSKIFGLTTSSVGTAPAGFSVFQP